MKWEAEDTMFIVIIIVLLCGIVYVGKIPSKAKTHECIDPMPKLNAMHRDILKIKKQLNAEQVEPVRYIY